eukprot:Rmarinus@m.30117
MTTPKEINNGAPPGSDLEQLGLSDIEVQKKQRQRKKKKMKKKKLKGGKKLSTDSRLPDNNAHCLKLIWMSALRSWHNRHTFIQRHFALSREDFLNQEVETIDDMKRSLARKRRRYHVLRSWLILLSILCVLIIPGTLVTAKYRKCSNAPSSIWRNWEGEELSFLSIYNFRGSISVQFSNEPTYSVSVEHRAAGPASLSLIETDFRYQPDGLAESAWSHSLWSEPESAALYVTTSLARASATPLGLASAVEDVPTVEAPFGCQHADVVVTLPLHSVHTTRLILRVGNPALDSFLDPRGDIEIWYDGGVTPLTDVVADTQAGSIRIEGVDAETIIARSSVGDISLSRAIANFISLRSDSGNVDVDGVRLKPAVEIVRERAARTLGVAEDDLDEVKEFDLSDWVGDELCTGLEEEGAAWLQRNGNNTMSPYDHSYVYAHGTLWSSSFMYTLSSGGMTCILDGWRPVGSCPLGALETKSRGKTSIQYVANGHILADTIVGDLQVTLDDHDVRIGSAFTVQAARGQANVDCSRASGSTCSLDERFMFSLEGWIDRLESAEGDEDLIGPQTIHLQSLEGRCELLLT